MSLKERQYQLREDAIIEQAQHLLEEQGYAAMNMDELAEQVGISKATLYQHFPSKDELIIQGILRNMQKAEETLLHLDAALPPLARLEQILRYGIQKRVRIAATRASTLPPHLREDPRIKAQHTRMAVWLTDLIDAAKAQGLVAKELSTPVIMRMIMTFFSPHYQDLLIEQIVSAEELSETLISIFFNGIRSAS